MTDKKNMNEKLVRQTPALWRKEFSRSLLCNGWIVGTGVQIIKNRSARVQALSGVKLKLLLLPYQVCAWQPNLTKYEYDRGSRVPYSRAKFAENFRPLNHYDQNSFQHICHQVSQLLYVFRLRLLPTIGIYTLRI